MANPDQLTLFLKQELDAAWAPEPWATRLIQEGNGRLFLDERDLWPNQQFVVTNLIVSTKFLREHPDLVKNWVRANVELTDWINGHLPEAKQLLNSQIQKETGKALPPALIDAAFGRFEVTYDPIRSSLLTSAQSAYDAGFLGRQMPDLSGLYDLSFLNQVLAEKKKKGRAMTTSPQRIPSADHRYLASRARRLADFGRGHRPAFQTAVEEQTPKVALQDITLRIQNERIVSAGA